MPMISCCTDTYVGRLKRTRDRCLSSTFFFAVLSFESTSAEGKCYPKLTVAATGSIELAVAC
jgi:hypothetical protein